MAKNDTERFSKELLDQLLAGRDPKSVLDSGGPIGDLKNRAWMQPVFTDKRRTALPANATTK